MKFEAKYWLAVAIVVGWVLGTTFALAADMTGTWDLEVETPSGSGTPTFELKQDGDKLSGQYEGAFGTSPVEGTVTGNQFVINFESGGLEMQYTGTIEGDAIKGKVDLGSYGEGEFTGKRK